MGKQLEIEKLQTLNLEEETEEDPLVVSDGWVDPAVRVQCLSCGQSLNMWWHAKFSYFIEKLNMIN